MNKILLLSLIHILPLAYAQINTNIIQIIIVNYHGIRGPLTTYPTDPYGESYWARYGGLGQITPRGLLQSYNLGQYIKNFYSNFLTPSYSPQRVRVRSVDSDPALVSTSTFLSGMFPPSNSDQLWSPTVSWFPIPIHPSESLTNPITSTNCPKHEILVKKSMNTTAHFATELKYMDLVKNISGYTALPDLKLFNMSHIFDNANSKLASNLPLELWLSETFQNVTNINEYLNNLKYDSVEKSRLISGGILLDIIKNIRNKMNGSKNEIHLYSCLDHHMISLMKLLNINMTMTHIPFETSLIFELRKDQNGLHYVNLMLRNNNQTELTSLIPVKMTECDQLCNFGNFFDILIKRTVSNLTEECEVEEMPSWLTRTTDSIYSTNFYSTPCQQNYNQIYNISNSTRYPYPFTDATPPRNELSRLELALIITTSILGAIILALLISFGLYVYKSKVTKVAF